MQTFCRMKSTAKCRQRPRQSGKIKGDMPDSLECGHSRFHYNCVCCQGLQKYWYDLLSQKGFRDAEDTNKPHRPLRVCSGISGEVTLKGFDEPVYLIDTVVFQPPHEPIKNVYLENPLSDEERL